MRGQAWVIFDDLSGATKALREMQGFQFYGKPMKVHFARSKSDVVSKIDGSFQPRPKRKVEGKAAKSSNPAKRKKIQQPNGETKAEEKSHPPAEHKEEKVETKESKHETKQPPETKPDIKPVPPTPPTETRPSGPMPTYQETPAPPNRILFVENLPAECNQMMLSMLFQQYPGFQEARLVNGKPGIAFVEFQNDYHAGEARSHLQNFKITPTNLMKISFAKK